MKIHRTRVAPLLGLLVFLMLACQLFSQTQTPLPPELSTYVADTLTALSSPSAPTSTPSPTATPPSPTETSSITLTPQPSLTPSDTPIPDAGPGFPPAAASIPQPAGQTTLILLGSDQRPNRRDFRTDIMVLVVLKPDGSVNLVSFPRDLWVYLPGRFMQRLNTAQEYGGFSLVQATFRYNFGFSPQSYVLTNFSGFTSIVNGLGGIDVPVGRTLRDARDGYFPYGYTVRAGTVHMDGETALWYVRARQVTGDLDRLRRSQEVLIGLGQKLLSLDGLAHIPDLYTSFRGAVVTDLTLGDVTGMLPALQKVDPAKLQRYDLGLKQLTPAILPDSGANVLLPKADAVRQLLLEALAGQ